MKKAFTLIELIFVIVIIGLLAAVAVPKFLNLKQNAEAANLIKATVDTASATVNVAVNLEDLENNASYELKDLVRLEGKGWSYYVTTGDNNGTYEYNSTPTDVVADIILYQEKRTVEYKIDCTKFADAITQAKCKKLLGDKDSIDVNLTY